MWQNNIHIIVTEIVQLIKEAYKERCFGESTTLRCHDDFKK